jgi:hypothetical protein
VVVRLDLVRQADTGVRKPRAAWLWHPAAQPIS